MLYRDAVLTREAPEDKVSILVQPSVLRTYSSYYYTPGGGDQEWLRQFMDSLPAGGESGTGLQKGLKETGWQIAYGDKCFMAFEGGYLQWSYVDEKGEPKTYMLYGHVHDTQDERLIEQFQEITRKTMVTDAQGNERSIPCNMINCFCKFSDYEPLTLDEWIVCDKRRRGGKEKKA